VRVLDQHCGATDRSFRGAQLTPAALVPATSPHLRLFIINCDALTPLRDGTALSLPSTRYASTTSAAEGPSASEYDDLRVVPQNSRPRTACLNVPHISVAALCGALTDFFVGLLGPRGDPGMGIALQVNVSRGQDGRIRVGRAQGSHMEARDVRWRC
jgi:hypothetical protein